jgi:hypothetical protein
MKTFNRLISIALIVPMFIFAISCEKKSGNFDGTGKAEFSISTADMGAKSDSIPDTTAYSYQLMVSVVDLEGNAVLTDKLIPLYVFGTGFLSENIELPAGNLKLTKFMVINASGEVIYASPLEGSPLAYLVNDPLPVTFTIKPDQVTKILPEVLFVGEHTPGDFGYASFGVQIIKPLHFWTMCVLDPSPLMPPIVITTAKLTVVAPDGWHYTFNLKAEVNHIIIRGGYQLYTFILEKEGYMTQKLEFSARELEATTRDNPLILSINWNSQLRKLVLQPGPEKGKDAMISNLDPDKNFGGHKYFEATFLSEPVLTVMRSNRSLIWFNPDSLPASATIRKVILQLTYDIPVPFDPSQFTSADPASVLWCGAVFQQIVEPWEEYKVTWNSQPKTITYNQVYLSPFIRNTNVIQVDVTRLFVQPINTDQVTYPNYGMLFRLWPTDRFPGFRFASSDYPLATTFSKMWPALTIYYTLP